MNPEMATLLAEVRACTVCAGYLPLGPRPIVRLAEEARILVVGQAPGTKVHASGIPWDDASGKRLRAWMGLEADAFYDETRIAIVPMGFCYPGKGSGGDMPPRPECAPLWHQRLLEHLPNRKLTLLIGQYAQEYYLSERRKATLGETVRAWEEYLPSGYMPLVHPSPRNGIWLSKNPWFEAEVVPSLQSVVQAALNA